MPNVVMIAKMAYVWLDQLSKFYGREIHQLDQIPDEELDRLAGWGFSSIWLIGVWERSPASQKIKRLCGNPEAVFPIIYDYIIAADLGGQDAFRIKAGLASGIRLATMVPTTGIYSNGPGTCWLFGLSSACFTARSLLFAGCKHFIEDITGTGDAAVVFKHVDNGSAGAISTTATTAPAHPGTTQPSSTT
jgi:hypothetical protein